MARILVQTNGRRTVLEVGDLAPADIDDEAAAGGLLDRLKRAVRDAERAPHPPPPRSHAPSPRFRRITAIVPATDYREVRG